MTELCRDDAGFRLRRILGWLSFALATYLLGTFLLGVSGLQSRLFESLMVRTGGTLLFNIFVGVLPTALWLVLLGGLWWLSRETPGKLAMGVAMIAVLLDQALENLWPALPQGLVANVLMWTAAALSVAAPLLIALGLRASRIVSAKVVRLALAWGIAHAAVGLSQVVFGQLVRPILPLGTAPLQDTLLAVAHGGLALLRIAVIAGIGISLTAVTPDSAGEVRLTSAST